MGYIQDIWNRVRGIEKDEKLELAKLDTLSNQIKELDAHQAQLFTLVFNQDKATKGLLEVLLMETQRNHDFVTYRINKVLSELSKIQALLETPPAVGLEIKIGGDVKPGENGMLKVGVGGSVLANLVAQDAAGNPGAKLDSVPQWTVSDAEMGSVNASEDGMTAVVVLTGKLGVFKVKASAQVGEVTLEDESDEIEVEVGAAALLRVDLAAK